jgi:hypothetical protein
MPLIPAGLLGFPTAPGHRPPLFYTKLKISFYKRSKVTFPSRTKRGQLGASYSAYPYQKTTQSLREKWVFR